MREAKKLCKLDLLIVMASSQQLYAMTIMVSVSKTPCNRDNGIGRPKVYYSTYIS